MKIKITCRPLYNPWLKKYLNTKTFSKILAFGILLNSIPINSFAGILSEDGRYEAFEGNNITIDNILEEDKVDVGIEGNTLVNLADIKSTFEIRNMNSWYEDFSVCETSKLKLNTDYTLFIYKELLDNHNENYNHFEIGLGNTLNFMEGHPKLDVSNSDYSNYSIDFINHSGNEVLKTKIKFNDFKEFQYLTVRPIRRYDKPITNEYANLNIKIVLLEGDYTKENIDYFEGIKSVGEDDINGHSIEIISTNSDNSEYNKIEIPLSEPLRGLPNGVKDRIVKRNGQWVIERNCGEVIYDGSNNEVWYVSSLNNDANNNMLFLTPKDDLKLKNTLNDNNTVISSILKTLTPSQTNSSVQNIEGISGNTRYSEFILNISKSKLGQANSNGLRQWLNNNPINVVYQLNEPVHEPLNIDLSIQLFEDITYISTNSTIPANLKVTIDRVANRAKEYSELAKENPTIENISLARMWTNLMKESILKDEFQDSVDSITEITDMILERKTASSNVDVYIKSENMLSMNLSTNSITFEDFSGVEDMIKENAVNISINSSLPYNLNAYLATEIQNSDKSTTINKDILSIKDNSELDYQTFSSINNKIILKENCVSGNDKQHDINLKLNGGIAHEKDVYKATIKFEAQQQ